MHHPSPRGLSLASGLLLCLALLLAAPAPLRAQSFTAISAGWTHSLGVKSDGTLWAWGKNEYGQLGDGGNTNRASPIQVGEGYTAVAAGSHHSLALKADGDLWAWGMNNCGQLGIGSTSHSNIPVLTGGGYIAMAAGGAHSLGLQSDNSLWSWGTNEHGQLGLDTIYPDDRLSPTSTDVVFAVIAAGYSHSLGLKANGDIWAWGHNARGELGDGTTSLSTVPIRVGEGFAAISAGDGHTLGLKTDGSLWAWGWNKYGQLGDGTTTDSTTPIQVGENFAAVVASYSHSLGVKTGGTLLAWGKNSAGQLGDGTTTDRYAPVQIGEGFSTVAGGIEHSLGIKADGSLWAWGGNGVGQLGDGTTTDRLVPTLIDAGTTPYVYFVPYAPPIADFTLGFGVSNAENAGSTGVTVDYSDNVGNALGQDLRVLPAHGHDSFMSSLEPALPGWARITATQPIEGMALVFGWSDNPLFDMDFKATTATNLTAAHVDTSGGWASLAMLANPGDTPANVTLTFRPNAGLPLQTADITIPAMGAVQYDLSQDFPDTAGALDVSSDQGLVGFILYDGRAKGYNYVGGLSMVAN